MSEPIRPEAVEVDRGVEDRWTAQINDELAKSWGPDECKRRIDLDGKFHNQRGLVEYLVAVYADAGWRVTSQSGDKSPDKYTTLVFERPGMPVFEQHKRKEQP